LSNGSATVRIYAPSGGYSSKGGLGATALPEIQAAVRDGRALYAGPPWPKAIVGPEGELPEYVVSEKGEDGRLTWVETDPRKAGEELKGFYNRARIDIDLVVDGKAIDLNRVKLPENVRVVDRRFEEE
jgi:hypothetical protein